MVETGEGVKTVKPERPLHPLLRAQLRLTAASAEVDKPQLCETHQAAPTLQFYGTLRLHESQQGIHQMHKMGAFSDYAVMTQ